MNIRRAPSLKARAIQWLAQREHSRSELRDKLLRVAAHPASAKRPDAADDAEPHAERDPGQTVDQLLGWLQSHGYLSEARFAESRTQVRAAKFGNLRIEREMRQHGVPIDAATRATLRDTELQRAREVWRRKYGQVAVDAATRLKQMRFLVGRGFSPEVVRQVLRGADDSTA